MTDPRIYGEVMAKISEYRDGQVSYECARDLIHSVEWRQWTLEQQMAAMFLLLSRITR